MMSVCEILHLDYKKKKDQSDLVTSLKFKFLRENSAMSRDW